MTTSINDKKLDEVLEAISRDIEHRKLAAKNAMLILEQMKPSDGEYKNANICFGLFQFVVGYLTHLKDCITGSNIKSAESLIRFHAHHQRTFGNLNDGSTISLGQTQVADLLDGYIARFFEA